MTLKTQHEKPVYVRLRETIADAILAGRFKDGDPLPSVRALAAEIRDQETRYAGGVHADTLPEIVGAIRGRYDLTADAEEGSRRAASAAQAISRPRPASAPRSIARRS